MLYSALRSFALAVCVWGMSSASPATARADDLTIIHFSDLERYARKESPRARILEQQIVELKASRDSDLQWTNPEISYQHEEIDEFREYQVTLHKRLAMPWVYGKKRSGWSARLDAAGLRTDHEAARLVADLRSGYVRIELLDEYLERLAKLEEIVTDARSVAEARHTEGQLSSVEKRLVQLSALSIDASRRKAMQEQRRFEAMWRGEMGIPPGTTVELATDIEYVPVALEPAQSYVSRLAGRPGVRSQVALGGALAKQARAAGPNLLPAIEVYAGYKHVKPDHAGLVAGVAASLPLFNWSGAAARELEAQRRIVSTELERYLSRTGAEIEALVALTAEMQESLEAFAFDDAPPAIGNLLYSYREGWLTLDGFLGGVRIEVDGLEAYYDQLISYYEHIFRLESLTGADIVSFDS